MDYFEFLFADFETKLLVFSRVLGIFAFNPLLSRRNMPTILKVGASVFIAAIAAIAINPAPVDTGNVAGVYLLLVVREGFVGLAIGFISNLFFLSVHVSGELMDMMAGLGMAKVFDPVSSTQSSIMGSIISFMMYLYFFVINAHLSFIKLFVLSYNIIPIVNWQLNPDFGWAVTEYFSVLLAVVLKFAMPIIVSEFILEFALGIMMKSVPQIQLMIINIQMKVVVGFMLLFVIARPISEFIDKYLYMMFDTIEDFIPKLIS